MATNPFIHVRSPKFGVLPGEDDELVNEGNDGKALALHLERELRALGWSTTAPVCEDWGWLVPVDGHPFRAGLCVYGILGDSGSLDFCVTVTPDPGPRRRWSSFRRLDPGPVVRHLSDDVVSVFVGDPEVELVGTSDEFPL